MYEFSPNHQRPLPTMYDLPSEEVGEPGLPDEFHRMQAELLRETCQSPCYPLPMSPGQGTESTAASTNEGIFIASDLNLYYDSRNPRLYKRPDWFMCLGMPNLGRQQDLRWSYLIWQESVAPFLVMEFLSPGTEADDLGETVRRIDQSPRKWDVYERLLRIPYYGVNDRYQNQFRLFQLDGIQYRELDLPDARFWFESLKLGLGIWSGYYEGSNGLWLRWYDGDGQWIPTEREQIEQEQARAQQAETQANAERERAQQAEANYQALLQKLREQGIDPDSL
ncbi:MAG: Uma2 family endonuclease [Leptolyngbyaceae cyanobacterium]